MRCPQCQHENRDGAKFCSACGARLDLSCPSCGTVNEPGAAFCDNCGAALTTKPRAKRRNGKTVKREKAVAPPQHPAPNPQHPIGYTPKHLAERILAERRPGSPRRNRRRAQNHHRFVCRSQRFYGADRRARPRRSPRPHRSGPAANDGGRASL